MKLTDKQLLAELKKHRSNEIHIIAKILVLLNEVFYRKLDLELSYPTMYEFAMEELGYEENEAYNRVRAAEALRIDPSLEKHLREGRVSMTALKQAQVAIRSEDARRKHAKEPELTLEEKRSLTGDILEKSTREVSRVITEKFPKLERSEERVKPTAGKKIKIEIIVTEEEFAEIEQLKNDLAHVNRDGKLAPVIMHAIRLANAKPKPREAKTPVAQRPGRAHIPAQVERQVHERAEHQCEYVSPDGRRCRSRYALQTDHIVEVALGGTNAIENLRCLCAKHNRFSAWKSGLRNPHDHHPTH